MPTQNSDENSEKRRGRPENLTPWKPRESGSSKLALSAQRKLRKLTARAESTVHAQRRRGPEREPTPVRKLTNLCEMKARIATGNRKRPVGFGQVSVVDVPEFEGDSGPLYATRDIVNPLAISQGLYIH